MIHYFSEAQSLTYTLDFPEPHTHYVRVSLNVENYSKDKVYFKLPTWTPGSYLIREYARHIDRVRAFDSNNTPLTIEKVDKNTWLLDPKGNSDYKIDYQVYAYELTVRTSFIDDSHAYLNPASICLYVEGLEDMPLTLNINPYKNWKVISTTLDVVGDDKWKRKSKNYDILVDSPIEIGNHEELNFDAAGIPHTLAIYGKHNLDLAKAVKDIQLIVEEAVKVFGKHPCDKYLFILLNTPNSRGGLEHLYSTSLIYKGFSYNNKTAYQNWLGLVAHEYFHLWNVKRLRPKPLGPFDYNKENYTTQLWIAEGFTSYYDNLLLKRSQLISSDNYLSLLGHDITNLENTPGQAVQSVAEASFDAWIKYYRRNENSNNTTISYYLKGSILTLLLDLTIIKNTKGKNNLDDLLRYLYQKYVETEKRGFTPEEFKKAAEKIAGTDLTEFIDNFIYNTQPLDYKDLFESVGVNFVETKTYKSDLGLTLKEKYGHLIIKNIKSTTPAYNFGLNVNDEIIAINGLRCDKDFFFDYLENQEDGKNMRILISRGQNILTIDIPFKKTLFKTYTLHLDDPEKLDSKQKKGLGKWLGDWE